MMVPVNPKTAEDQGVDLYRPRTLLAGRKVPANEAARHCENVGWKDIDKLLAAIATMYAESDGYEQATHENDNGTVDRGAWQINSIHVDAGRITVEDCFKVKPSTEFAYQLYKNRGYTFNAWVAYTSGAYLRKMPEATRGVANAHRYWLKLPFLVEQ